MRIEQPIFQDSNEGDSSPIAWAKQMNCDPVHLRRANIIRVDDECHRQF